MPADNVTYSSYEQQEGPLQDSEALAGQSLEDSIAIALVNSNYELYRQYRWRNHDPRWATADALYFGWQPPKFWDGTRIERSHLGYPIVFDQIESALPIITNALWGDEEWFKVIPVGQTTVEEARQQKERLTYLLDTPNDRTGMNARTNIDLAVKQLLQYGNGMIDIVYDATTGNPTVSWEDTRDLYIDPGCKTPCIDDSKSVVSRQFLTVDQIEDLRGSPGIKLPPFSTLKLWADERPFDSSDITKQQQEIFRQVIYRPGFDDLQLFLASKSLEVMIYKSESRTIWVLQRKWVMYNETNPYGFITNCSAPCYIVPSRFYAMGFADVLEMNQKYAQAIVNGRLDELQLSLDPPRAKKRGTTLTASSKSLRPGLIMEYENPKEDMIMFPPINTTQNGWQELSFLDSTAERRTGVTQMIQQGTPMRSNASRTATGIQAQAAGPTSRLQRIVEMVENYMIVPMLYKVVAMDRYHAQANSKVRGLAPGGKYTEIPVQVLKAQVRFKMEASSRMLNQGKLQQIVPFLSQYLMNGPFLAQLSKAGQTVDFNEFSEMLQDATGTRHVYNLFRPRTDQEKQAMSQPSPETQAKMQMQDKSNQTRMEVAQMKAAADAAGLSEESALRLLEIFHQIAQSNAGAGAGPEQPGQPGTGPALENM